MTKFKRLTPSKRGRRRTIPQVKVKCAYCEKEIKKSLPLFKKSVTKIFKKWHIRQKRIF